MVPARQVLAVKMKSEKRVKHHMVFLLFYCISCRCRLLEGFGFGFVFCLSFSCRLLEGFGCGGEFTKKNLEWMFWKVLAGENQLTKKKVKRHMVFFFFTVSHSGVGFWKILALGLFFASHSAVGFWKVLAVEMNAQKQLKIDVLASSGCENQLTKNS